MNETTFEISAEKGELIEQKSAWRWFLASVFGIPALVAVFACHFFVVIADFLLFDTHHFVFEVTPKNKRSILKNKLENI